MYSLDNVSIKSYPDNLEEYRADKELSGLYLIYKERFKKDYPEYYKFIKEAQDKFYSSSVKDITMGVDYGFYHQMARQIIDHKCKHIVEYGPGFTTLLLHRIVQDLDWEAKVYSYEDNKTSISFKPYQKKDGTPAFSFGVTRNSANKFGIGVEMSEAYNLLEFCKFYLQELYIHRLTKNNSFRDK